MMNIERLDFNHNMIVIGDRVRATSQRETSATAENRRLKPLGEIERSAQPARSVESDK